MDLTHICVRELAHVRARIQKNVYVHSKVDREEVRHVRLGLTVDDNTIDNVSSRCLLRSLQHFWHTDSPNENYHGMIRTSHIEYPEHAIVHPRIDPRERHLC